MEGMGFQPADAVPGTGQIGVGVMGNPCRPFEAGQESRVDLAFIVGGIRIPLACCHVRSGVAIHVAGIDGDRPAGVLQQSRGAQPHDAAAQNGSFTHRQAGSLLHGQR